MFVHICSLTKSSWSCDYLHAERFPALLAAVYELLQSICVSGLLVGLLHLLLDVFLYLGVDEVPRLQTLDDRGWRDGQRRGREGTQCKTVLFTGYIHGYSIETHSSINHFTWLLCLM